MIFISLIKKNFQKKELEYDDDRNTKRAVFKRQLIIAVCLTLMFGLGWGLGLPAIEAENIPQEAIRLLFQASFAIFFCLQGPLIFIMQCVRSSDAREEWKKWLTFISCNKIVFKSTKSSALSNLNHRTPGMVKSNTLESGISLSDSALKPHRLNCSVSPSPSPSIDQIDAKSNSENLKPEDLKESVSLDLAESNKDDIKFDNKEPRDTKESTSIDVSKTNEEDETKLSNETLKAEDLKDTATPDLTESNCEHSESLKAEEPEDCEETESINMVERSEESKKNDESLEEEDSKVERDEDDNIETKSVNSESLKSRDPKENGSTLSKTENNTLTHI